MSSYKEYAKLAYNFIFKRVPINSDDDISCDPFFIIGAGRSGNTLLRAILVNHSKISIPPESFVLRKVVKKFKIFNFLLWRDIVKIVIGEFQAIPETHSWGIDFSPVYRTLLDLDKKERSLAKIIDAIYKFYSRKKFPGSVIWGDKTPLNTLHLDTIDKISAKSRYIHIIRDGRDAVSSMVNRGIFDSVEEACGRWNKSVELAREFGEKKSNDHYMEVKYEELVSHPKLVIKEVCEFLGVQYEKNMTEYHAKLEKMGDTGMTIHNNLKKPITTDFIGKWKDNLSPEQQKKVSELLRERLKLLDYI